MSINEQHDVLSSPENVAISSKKEALTMSVDGNRGGYVVIATPLFMRVL